MGLVLKVVRGLNPCNKFPVHEAGKKLLQSRVHFPLRWWFSSLTQVTM